ncbi:hypothetical protein QEH59_17720 [Coraliomargarita sp. SDUM461004]|uniref:RNA polymerase sigma-70 region 4 domain-containing protein n=1 Tax=Thalassobacterium sedimentorum TaxID=3041258 RepID=A0ABU1APW7_9BACT|nr:hypothetical protein [Coraliomargarita sp. SDUM461004]MDQ8196278.1 hypothetical protein [Coraliomargarita sp. SDUM461004]
MEESTLNWFIMSHVTPNVDATDYAYQALQHERAVITAESERLAKGSIGKPWEDLDPQYFNESIQVLELSRVENSLMGAGFETMAAVVEWANQDFTPSLRSLGKKKIKLICDRLRELSNTPPPIELLTGIKLKTLHPSVASLPSDHFHLGARASSLSKSGYRTVLDLADWYQADCPELKGFGKKSVKQAKEVLEALASSLDENGMPNWDQFCDLAGITLLPREPHVDEKECFLITIPNIIEDIIRSAADEVEADIIRNRLTRTSKNQLTLEDLGRKHRLTRERIRQKQQKLLLEISNGLMEGLYVKREYRFRLEYAAKWKKAEEAFGGDENIDGFSFLLRLSEVWEVKVSELIDHLPLIFAVLTSTNSIPNAFRVYAKYPILTGSHHIPEFLQKPVCELYLGNKLKILEHLNITTLGELVEIFCGFPDEFNSRVFSEFFENMESFLQTLDSPQGFSWKEYYAHRNFTILPEVVIESPYNFLSCLKPSILKAVTICSSEFYQHSREILLFRSFPAKDERLTAQELADKVGCHGPTISKNELELNSRLRSLLVERNFSKSTVIFEDTFLEFWSNLSELYDEGLDVKNFKFKLAQNWALPLDDLDEYINLIWSILSNHPRGKNRKNYTGVKRPRKIAKAVREDFVAPVIVLRKRRMLH